MIEVDTEKFKQAMARMHKLTGSTESNTVRLESDGSALQITGIAVTGRMRSVVPCTGSALAPVYVDKDVLSNILATRVLEAPVILDDKDKAIHLRQGAFKSQITKMKGTYAFEEEANFEYAWPTNGAWLSHVLDVCAVPVDKDYTKTRGVLISLQKNSIFVVGADSVGPGQIHIFEAQSDKLPGADLTFTMSKQSANMLAAIGPSEVRLESTGRKLMACGTDTVYRVSAIRNQYQASLRKLFYLDECWGWQTIDFDRAQLMFALASAQSAMSDGDQAYKFTLNERQGDNLVVKITGRDDRMKNEATDVVLAVGVLANPLKFALRRGKVESSLRCMQGDRVRFHVRDADTSVVMTEIPDSGFRAVHLPLRT